MNQSGAWKILEINKTVAAISGETYIPDQVADRDCPFIHSCDYESIRPTIEKFFAGEQVRVVKLNIEQAAREGFTVKYEANKPGGTKYWHFYRPAEDPTRLLSTKCILELR